MTMVQELARWVAESHDEQLGRDAREQLKIRIVDALACAIGALGHDPLQRLRRYVDELGGQPLCTLLGGGRTAPDRAAFYNGALVRYLDYNDSYLAPGETCHPSDNFGAVLAASELAGARGETLLTALAVAYQVQCRLSDVAPVRVKGFDHTTQGAYAAAAGVARALGLDAEQTANALAIAGTAFNALRVTRTGALSHWKGLASANTAGCATQAALLARAGITGPAEVFEGRKGFMESIAGPFSIDWMREGLERVTRTITKRFNAEIHAQSAIAAALQLKHGHGFDPGAIESVEVEIFDVAYHIIGGGEEGQKYDVRTKEQADHSLPYLIAVALLDDWVGPAQYTPERIAASDVQQLLRRVHVERSAAYSRRFPAQLPVRVRVRLRGGGQWEREEVDYAGFFTRPLSWGGAREKLARLTAPRLSAARANEIVAVIERLEQIEVRELTGMLAAFSGEN